jgi:hypothetical protein
MQDAKQVVVEEVYILGVAGTLDVSGTLCSTILEEIDIDFFLDLLLNPGVDGESIDSL